MNNKSIEQILFKPSDIEKIKYKEQIREFLLSGRLESSNPILLGKTPIFYNKVGFKLNPLYIRRKTINKINYEKHNVNFTIIDNLQNLLYNPIAIFRSVSREAKKGSCVILLDGQENGKQLIASICPYNDRRNNINMITSIYGLRDFNDFLKKSEKELLYIDKEKTLKNIMLPEFRYLESILESSDSIVLKEEIVKDL